SACVTTSGSRGWRSRTTRWRGSGRMGATTTSSRACASWATSTSPSISPAFSPARRICYLSWDAPVDREALKILLDAVAAGRLSADDAAARLRDLPYADLGFAKVDLHRALRAGGAEAVFCPGKTPAQVVAILKTLVVDHVNVLATRADDAIVAAVAAAGLPHA